MTRDDLIVPLRKAVQRQYIAIVVGVLGAGHLIENIKSFPDVGAIISVALTVAACGFGWWNRREIDRLFDRI